jgi:hypothetical protein
MNREDVIRLVEQAGNGKIRDPFNTHMFFYDELERFAALVSAAEEANATAKFLEWHAEVVKLAVLAERESCEEVCNRLYWDDHVEGAQHCESAIRARGEK